MLLFYKIFQKRSEEKYEIEKTFSFIPDHRNLCGGVITTSAAELDYAWYAAKNPDVVAAVGDSPEALREHYETFGRKEARMANENDVEAKLRRLFDAKQYAALYPDVKEAYGDDEEAMFQHYITFGILETRKPSYRVSYEAAVALKNAIVKELEKAGLPTTPGLAPMAAIIEGNLSKTAGSAAAQQILAQVTAAVDKAVAEMVNEANNPKVSSSSGSSSGKESSVRTERVDYSNGQWRIYEYDSAGKMIKETLYNADGSIIECYKFEYDSAGKMIKETLCNADGSIFLYTKIEYDSAGRVLKRTQYNAGGSITGYSISEYRSTGNWIRTNYDPDNNKKMFATEFAGNKPIKEIHYSSDGSWWGERLDENGNWIEDISGTSDDDPFSDDNDTSTPDEGDGEEGNPQEVVGQGNGSGGNLSTPPEDGEGSTLLVESDDGSILEGNEDEEDSNDESVNEPDTDF